VSRAARTRLFVLHPARLDLALAAHAEAAEDGERLAQEMAAGGHLADRDRVAAVALEAAGQ
jgi:hypothetical protein